MKTYLVGGAVRDKLLGLVPKDRDWVIVGATDNDVAELMTKGYTQVGADFPVFLHPETSEEYALARIERKQGVGYHGFVVDADSSVTIEDDLARRDLTINSMAMDSTGVVIDPYGGLHDLHNKILRHTTAAFAEDPLRVLRLARFAARMPDWSIHADTIELCRTLCAAGELNHLSIERVWTEMEKGFGETDPRRFMELLETTYALKHCAVLREIFGDVCDEGQHIAAKVLKMVAPDQRLAVSVAVLAVPDSAALGASARVRDCMQNLNVLRTLPRDASSMSYMLKKARALSEGMTFNDLVSAVMVLEYAGYRLPFSSKQLVLGQRLMKDVKATEFPGVDGKALGVAIENRRVQNLQYAMAIPKSEVQQQQG
jgi:hypothetical protein